MNVEVFCFDAVAPVRERGLKWDILSLFILTLVAPVRERGLKFLDICYPPWPDDCRSREGAWIEMARTTKAPCVRKSLP